MQFSIFAVFIAKLSSLEFLSLKFHWQKFGLCQIGECNTQEWLCLTLVSNNSDLPDPATEVILEVVIALLVVLIL